MAITLSKKHGLNPSMMICPICGKDVGIALFGRLKGDAEAPKVIKSELCDDCKTKYITIIEVESENNPVKTGRHTFVPKEAINVDCPKGIALMNKIEFNKLFANG